MKNKLTVILSAALAVVGIVAIAAPVGIAVTSQQKIDSAKKEQEALKAKTIAGLLKSKPAFDKIKEDAVSIDAAVTAINLVEDKSTLFSVVNENDVELTDALATNGIGVAKKVETETGNYIEFPLTWNIDMKYNLPTNMLTSGRVLYEESNSVEIKANFNEIVNAMDLSTVGTTDGHTTLQGLLNSADNKPEIVKAITNGDKITLGEITVAEATSTGYTITIPYTAKTGNDIPEGTLTVNTFKINVTIAAKANAFTTLRAIDGVGAADDATKLANALRAGKAEINAAFDNGDKITIDDLTVTPGSNDNTHKISIQYTAKHGFNPTPEQLIIDNFTVAEIAPGLI